MIINNVHNSIETDEDLRSVALELMYNNPAKWKSPLGPTAPEIARRLGLKTEDVKKKLKILLEAQLVRIIGLSPKHWQFDDYHFERMDPEESLFLLISRYDDDDFHKYNF